MKMLMVCMLKRVFIFPLLFLTLPVQGAVFGSEAFDSDAPPLRIEGALSSTSLYFNGVVALNNGSCTATPIRDDVLLTAAHCVDSGVLPTVTYDVNADHVWDSRIHEIQPDDTLIGVADQYETTVQTLRFMNRNEVWADLLENGQLPAAGTEIIIDNAHNIRAESVTLHPRWHTSQPAPYEYDIALVFLPATNRLPANVPVYRFASEYPDIPFGSAVNVGGYGSQGTPFQTKSNRIHPVVYVQHDEFGNSVGLVEDTTTIDRRYGAAVVRAAPKGSGKLFYTFLGDNPGTPVGSCITCRPASIAPGDSGGAVFISNALQFDYYNHWKTLQDAGVTTKLISSMPTIIGINSHILGRYKRNPDNSIVTDENGTYVNSISPADYCPVDFWEDLSELGDRIIDGIESIFTPPFHAKTCESLYAGYVYVRPFYSWIESSVLASTGVEYLIQNRPSPPEPIRPSPAFDFTATNAANYVPEVATTPQAGDSFPNKPEANRDSDNDGFPDNWSAIATRILIESSTLKLDKFPFDSRYALDDDADGLADEWEIDFFGDIDLAWAGDDVDGDGGTNYQEFLAETDPTINPFTTPTIEDEEDKTVTSVIEEVNPTNDNREQETDSNSNVTTSAGGGGGCSIGGHQNGIMNLLLLVMSMLVLITKRKRHGASIRPIRKENI